MANTPSAKKAARKIARRTATNKARKSRVRTFLKQVEEAIASGDRAKATEALRAAEPEMMRAAQKGVSIFEAKRTDQVENDVIQWKPLLKWLKSSDSHPVRKK